MSDETDVIEGEEKEESLLDIKGDWFFVQTLSGHEMKVQENIEKRSILENVADRVHKAIIPVEKITEVKDGEKVIKKKKFFPGYILIIADMFQPDGSIDDELWLFFRNIPSVTGFISEKPIALSEAERMDIFNMMTEHADKQRPKIDFNVGEVVKIKEGPFQNLDGKIEDIDPDQGKLKLSVSIFGRSTPVELGYWQVERE